MGITVTDVSKTFDGEVAALSNVSIEVEPGSLTALLGPSGSGKSTLLRVIAGLEPPDTGRVEIDGRDITRLPPQRRGIGVVFQHYAAFTHMTVRDNIAFGLKVRRQPKETVRMRVDELLELVQLQGLGKRYPNQLSGGQRQRMALARALAVEPAVLLLDEPFGALDARVRAELRAHLRRLHDEVHTTTVLVTHDRDEAMEVADNIAVMDQGEIVQVAAPKELYDKPSSPFVMKFLGPVNRVGDGFVRPHDMELRPSPNGTTIPARILRLLHLGFEVRVELEGADGERIWAQVTRDEADALDLRAEQTVFVRPRRQMLFSAGSGI